MDELCRFRGCLVVEVEGPLGNFPAVSAVTVRARTLGLMLLPRLRAVPLLIPGCRSVQTSLMLFRLNVAFLREAQGLGHDSAIIIVAGTAYEVVSFRSGLKPLRVASCRRATAVLEMPAAIEMKQGG